jgi:AcrR family transcriptional regulator
MEIMDQELSKRDANKIKNKELLIAAAEKLFLQKDFENTMMDDVSKEAGLTKRTIYQYFNSKEDLFFAVAVKGTRQLISYCEEAIHDGKNALEKIRLVNKAFYQFYMDNPGMFRIMNYLPDNKLNFETSSSYRELGTLKDIAIKHYMDIVDEGKSDGSINPNLDTKKAVYFGFCSSMGLLNMISAMDKGFFWQRDGLDENDFLLFSLNLLADAFSIKVKN